MKKIITIDEYIQQSPPQVQEHLTKLRQVIQDACPQAQETMSWQMPTFVLHGNLVHFAAQKMHIGFHPGASGVEAFLDKLTDYKTSKGTVQFPLNRPIPYGLVAEIVRFRANQNIKAAAAKANKSPMWTCEICGRTFPRKNQSHSCNTLTLEQAFWGWREKWLPLYGVLKKQATARLGEFTEYFPTVGVIWKHNSTFAAIKCRKEALQIVFYADRLHPERNPVKTMQPSTNRVAHLVEVTDDSLFPDILNWIAESYVLTEKRPAKRP